MVVICTKAFLLGFIIGFTVFTLVLQLLLTGDLHDLNEPKLQTHSYFRRKFVLDSEHLTGNLVAEEHGGNWRKEYLPKSYVSAKQTNAARQGESDTAEDLKRVAADLLLGNDAVKSRYIQVVILTSQNLQDVVKDTWGAELETLLVKSLVSPTLSLRRLFVQGLQGLCAQDKQYFSWYLVAKDAYYVNTFVIQAVLLSLSEDQTLFLGSAVDTKYGTCNFSRPFILSGKLVGAMCHHLAGCEDTTSAEECIENLREPTFLRLNQVIPELTEYLIDSAASEMKIPETTSLLHPVTSAAQMYEVHAAILRHRIKWAQLEVYELSVWLVDLKNKSKNGNVSGNSNHVEQRKLQKPRWLYRYGNTTSDDCDSLYDPYLNIAESVARSGLPGKPQKQDLSSLYVSNDKTDQNKYTFYHVRKAGLKDKETHVESEEVYKTEITLRTEQFDVQHVQVTQIRTITIATHVPWDFKILERFLITARNACKAGLYELQCLIYLVYFEEESDGKDFNDHLRKIRDDFIGSSTSPTLQLATIKGESQSLARMLQIVSSGDESDSIILLLRPEYIFTSGLLYNCAANVEMTTRMYFPIPAQVSEEQMDSFDKNQIHWLAESYDVLCGYAFELQNVDSFPSSSKALFHWMTDTENIEAFRAPDPNLRIIRT